ncbi:MAG: hypothetical protein ACFFDI_26985, partial [Promethearchaeota archaeon]
MWLNLKFAIQFSFNSIQKNFLRSLSIIISIVLIISTTVTMLGWLEESPKKAVEAAFENRGFEIKISEVYYHEGGLETLGDYLKTEAIVENISIIHRSIFLYNLDNRSSNFSVLNPPVNESDFYISKDDLSNGVFFIPNYHLNYIKNLLQFEPESKVSFVDNDNRSQVIISHRMLSLIEERMNQPDLNQTETNQTDTNQIDTNQTDTNQTETNQTDTNQLKLTIGSAINFSIATQFLPRYHEELTDLNPVPFENLIIGAIYDRIPSESQVAFGLDFYHETVGDGLFISNELLTENLTSQIEENGFFPTLFVRLNRTYLTNLPLDQVTTQINHLSARIHQQGRYKIEVQIDEINSMLHIFSQSYVVLLLMLFPILLLAEIFYLALVPHLINSRVEEFFYLRLRGTSDRKMMIIEGVEFAFLTSIGLIFGLLGGEIFLDILLFTNNFLQVPLEFLYAEGRSLLDTQNETLLIGVTIILLVNLSYFFFQFQRLLRRLEEFKSEKRQTRSIISKQSFSQAILKLLISGLIL